MRLRHRYRPPPAKSILVAKIATAFARRTFLPPQDEQM